ncbi:sensor histidine kinase [Heyndrickxia sp. NPDC080065]|uniref:sensor histidine kinase n=1 Tax=Heyndrickxia sp. NPDC080065 TaxID=3390568 RepID=UPI003D05A322
MTIILAIIIVVLVGIIFFQYLEKKAMNTNLTYICEKLQSILDNQTNEKLLVVTDDKYLKSLLVAIDQLLEVNAKMKANYIKTENSMRKMLSNISHDLKTPLTVILGYIEILNVDTTMKQEERNQLLEKLHLKTREVLDLINKFFDLAKLESGDKDIPLTKVNINEICRKNILSHYETLSLKQFEVKIEIPEANLFALGNEEVLIRILNNLITNAITYGEDGKMIGLSIRNDDEFVFIDIIDKGKGIEELHIDRVFERMYTLEDSRNKDYQGSGLGLTITKRLVEALGGEIHLVSQPYEKTVFTIMLKKISY